MNLMPNGESTEPIFINEPKTPFSFLPKFLVAAGILMIILGGFLGYKFLYKPVSTPQIIPPQAAKPIQDLKSLIGTIEEVDIKQNTITISDSKKEMLTLPISPDVLISQISLGTPSEEGKQVSLPTTKVNLEDLAEKIGQEVYLVFDSEGQNITQIQIYIKGKQ